MWIAIALLAIGQVFLFLCVFGHFNYHYKEDQSILESALKAAEEAELYEEAVRIKELLDKLKK